MTALRRDLVIEQGASWNQAWRFTVGGQPFVDASWTVRAQARQRQDATEVLHEWTSTGPSANASIDNQGTVVLTVEASTSSAWAWRYGVYDLEVSKAGVTHRLVEGLVRVVGEVTR